MWNKNRHTTLLHQTIMLVTMKTKCNTVLTELDINCNILKANFLDYFNYNEDVYVCITSLHQSSNIIS